MLFTTSDKALRAECLRIAIENAPNQKTAQGIVDDARAFYEFLKEGKEEPTESTTPETPAQ
jgi:hypothetical protein